MKLRKVRIGQFFVLVGESEEESPLFLMKDDGPYEIEIVTGRSDLMMPMEPSTLDPQTKVQLVKNYFD